MNAPLRPTGPAYERLGAGAYLARHRHARAYAALVLEGSYEEAGDHGRWRVSAGDLVVHSAFDAHHDRIASAGCALLNLPLPPDFPHAGAFHPDDPDELAYLARGHWAAAAAYLLARPLARVEPAQDWPDLLAANLRRAEPFAIRDWSRAAGLSAARASRGFRRVYGVSPKRYRLENRARRALRMIVSGTATLADIAFRCGFADQPHLTRSVVALTGATPGRLRRSGGKSVQDRAAPMP